MGMAGPDILLFVVGLLLFGGAVTAIVIEGGPAALGGGGSPTGLYTVAFPTKSVEVMKRPVADFGTQQKLDVPVDLTNVATLHFTIQCTDPAGAVGPAAFNIQLQVTPPAGIEKPAPKAGACGSTIAIDVTIAPAPPGTSAQGSTMQAAAASIQPDPNATKSQGTWSVTVAGARGGGALPVGVPAGNPSGSITVAADVWEAKLTAVPK